MSKSKRTQERHRKANRSQSSLTSFNFAAVPILHTEKAVQEPEKTSSTLQQQMVQSSILTFASKPVIPAPGPGPSRAQSALVLSDPSTDGDQEDAGNLEGLMEEEEADQNSPAAPLTMDDDYASELDEMLEGPKPTIQDWSELRKKIKAHLAKHKNTLPLSHINQYLIISNFATLQLKGVNRTQASLEIAKQWHEGTGKWFAHRVRALTWHYQIFEELPEEWRGGGKNTRSLLYNEIVEKRTRDWLTSQPTGKVTPRRLQDALNSVIFPDLEIRTKSPLSEQTARRWLIKLGWRRTVVRKGVYMDGHEREDVVKYRQEVFLPIMAKFEARMAKFEGVEMKRVPPVLKDGEKEVVMLFHDECCFHANDEARSLW